MTTSEIFLIGLSVLNLIVLILILIKVFSKTSNAEYLTLKQALEHLMRSTADEFQRSRNDNILQNIRGSPNSPSKADVRLYKRVHPSDKRSPEPV